MTTYKIKLTFTEPTLGTCPADQQIYSNFITTKKYQNERELAKKLNDQPALDRIALEQAKLAVEETALVPEEPGKGITVFRRSEHGLLAMDFMIRGFLKEASKAVSGVWGADSKIDRWLFVKERTILFKRDGQPIMEADAVFERPLRAQTMQGPRVCLAASEVINPGATLEFHLMVLPLGEKDKKMPVTEELLRSWLDYGALLGLGQFRTGSYGRFTYTLEKV
jgi:hypothetical protein